MFSDSRHGEIGRGKDPSEIVTLPTPWPIGSMSYNQPARQNVASAGVTLREDSVCVFNNLAQWIKAGVTLLPASLPLPVKVSQT